LLNLALDNLELTPKPKHSMLPLLIVLFLVSYGLMALLVVEQGQTIDAQRNLIRQLFSDSTELSSMKGHANQKQHAEAQAQGQAQAQAQADAHSQAQTPSAQAPRGDAKSDRKLRRPVPPKPPQDTSEIGDERRTLLSI